MKNLKPRIIILILGVLACLLSVALIMIKGNPENRVSLDSISEIGEGLLSSLGKTKNILLPIGDDEEMEIGNRIHERVVKSRFASKPGEASVEKYVNDVGNKVVQNVKRREIKYKFHLVDGYYPAAFSVAGGHIYVTTGLISTLKSEAELAGVLAHEVTHVDVKHCIGSIQLSARNQDLSATGSQTLIDVGYALFLKTGYSEAQESEADLGGVYLLHQAGYHPMAIIHAFQRINKDELLKSGQDRSATMVGDTLNAVGGMVLRYFKTHPPTEDRINKIIQYIYQKRLIDDKHRYYVGEVNLEKKVSFGAARYVEEYAVNYPTINETKTSFEKDVFLVEDYNRLLNTKISTSLKGRVISVQPVSNYYEAKIEYWDPKGRKQRFSEWWRMNPGNIKAGDQIDLSYVQSNKERKVSSNYRLYMPPA